MTQYTPAQWAAASTATFQGFSVLVMGDPSSGGSCSSLLPVTGTAGSGQESVGTNWQAAVTGNIAVAGTAPALPGTAGADSLITDAVNYAASQPSSGSVTGLYVSLNCEYSAAAAGTTVPLLNGVEGIGAAGGLTVNGGLSCGDAGTVNTWEADAAGTFGGFTSADLSAGSTAFPAPACPVQEAFDVWPAMVTPVGYDAAADATADFTASDGVSGQPYVLLGAPSASAATLALSPAVDGDVPPLATSGGSNAAASGLDQPMVADGVNPENGDFTQSAADLSIPTSGPALGFTRTYDAQAAQLQEQTGMPGSMGYGWTDNWASSVTRNAPVPGDIYALDGLAGAPGTGDGLTAYAADGQAPASAPAGLPGGVLISSGNVYYADSGGNRVEEVAGSTGTQWGISMTAGDAYTIAGSATGGQGSSGDTFKGYNALLSAPAGLAMDASGDLYIADSGNYRVQELAASGGTQWGQSMLAGHIYTVAGDGGLGDSGDGGAATLAQLGTVTAVALDPAGNLYLADAGDNQVQEVAAASGNQWGTFMTAADIYTVAGSSAGTAGRSANGTTGGSSLLNDPQGIEIDSSTDMYIADTGNNRVIEMPKSSGSSWGYSMSAGDVYDVAGSAAGTAGSTGDGSGAYSTALLDAPDYLTLDGAGDMIIADTANNRVQFVPKSAGTLWGQPVSAGDMYTIAGSASGTSGNSGNGGTGTSALLNGPGYVALDGPGNIYIADTGNNQVRKLTQATNDIALYAGDGRSLASSGNGGPAINGELVRPGAEISDSHGDLYIADTGNNRIQEIAAYSHTQWGIPMTGGDVYTIAGSATGQPGDSGDGGLATAALLDYPEGLAFDPAGDLLVVDQFSNQVRQISASTGDISTIAGSAAGTAGTGSDGVAAASGLLDHPFGLAVDSHGDIYIADKVNNRIQEIYASGGNSWGQSMTAGDIYTVAGSAAGTSGDSGDGGAATSAKLGGPEGVAVDAAGNLYIADTSNEQVREIPVATGTQWNRQLTRNDIYTLAGSTAGTAGDAGTGGPAAASQLHTPVGLAADDGGDLFIADGANDRVQEIAAASGTQWGTQMEDGDIYTVAGQPGQASDTGNGGPAFMATIDFAMSSTTDSYGDLYIADWSSGQLREVTSATPATIDPSPGVTIPSALYPPPGSTINGTTYPAGITVTQPGGAQVTFYPQGTGGTCTAPQDPAGGYCVMPAFDGATLTASGSASWTFTPGPGSDSGTYSQVTGQLTAQTDPAGTTLTITYNSPAPGAATTGTSTPITCPSSASSCDTITSASGRALVTGSDTNGQVTSVTDPMGREWTYSYNTAGDLASATDPMGNATSYTYDTTSTNPVLAGDLLTITSPNAQPGGPDAGDATVSSYDTQGRVTSQTDPAGWQTTISYCLSATSGNCLDTATGSGPVTVTDPDGNSTIYDYTQGTLAARASWTGTTLTSETDNIPDTTITTASSTCPGNTDGSLLDTSTYDGDGNQTSYCYDAAGDTIATASPSGGSTSTGAVTTTASYTTAAQNDLQNCSGTAQAASTATCIQDLGPAAVRAGATITPPSSAPPAGLTWTQYDTSGNELYTTTGVYSPAGTYQYSQTTYQLYNGNTVTLPGTSTAVSCTNTAPSVSLPCATIDADGNVTQLEHNAQGDVISSATPDGNGSQLATTTDSYDADGEQLTEIAPDGNVAGGNVGNYTTTTAYNADGEHTAVTQGDGSGYTDTPRTTSYGYDANGNQTTVKDPRGYTTTTSYNADDQPVLVQNPDGSAVLTCYDGDGNTAQTVPAVGVAANSLTIASCPTAYPAGYSTRLASDATISTFNAIGQETQQTTPAPAGQTGYETTTYTYDGDGNLLTTTAPPTSNGGQNQVVTNAYNSAGQMASQTTGSGNSASTVSYCYNPDGQESSAVYADGDTAGTAPCATSSPWTVAATPQVNYQTTYSYDSDGELVSTTTPKTAAAPSGATTTCTYDPAGNMLTRTDPDGVTTTWTYTPLNLPASVSYTGSSAHSVTYSYDASGNKTGMTDTTGSSSYGYDSFGELTSARNGAGHTNQYGYNLDGQVSSITYPLPSTATWATSDTVTYGYDNADLLTSVTDFNSNQITIGSTADGLPSTAALGSTGDTITTSYDPTDAPSAITLKNSSSTLQSFTYTDAPSGNILSETDTPSSAQTPAVYTYDNQGRVSSMTPGTGTADNYSFDASSNLTTLSTGATASYDDASELASQILSGATTSYAYNADGEQLTATQGSTTISSATWNGAGQLTTYSNNAADMTAATYDGNGLRTSSTITPASQPAVTQQYVWDTAVGQQKLIMDSTKAYIYAVGGTPVEQVNLATGAVVYLTTDRLGSVRSLLNSSGALEATATYDAWGNPQASGGLTAYTPFGYAGSYTDPDGFLYLINRYYDPETAQFLSVDSDVASTQQAYGYAQGNPVSEVDPNGLAPTLGWSGSEEPDQVEPSFRNDAGCEGYYKNRGSEWGCVATADDTNGKRSALRWGYWDGENGYGVNKVEIYHNLNIQPILDAITISHVIEHRMKPNRRIYHVWWLNGEQGATEEVTVVIDLLLTFKGEDSPDGRQVGLLTAYCSNAAKAGDPVQTECPDWINSSL